MKITFNNVCISNPNTKDFSVGFHFKFFVTINFGKKIKFISISNISKKRKTAISDRNSSFAKLMAQNKQFKIRTKNVVDFNPTIEEEWNQYKRALFRRKPSAEVLKKRWYRNKFVIFANNYFKDRKESPPTPMPIEEVVIKSINNSQFKVVWEKEKARLLAMEPTDEELANSWFRERKTNFIRRWHQNNTALRINDLREEPKPGWYPICRLRKHCSSAFITINNYGLIINLILLCLVLFKEFHWNKYF